MPNSHCDSCAFGKTGGAADEANNRLKGLLCALGPIPFFCHHDRDGKEYDWKNDILGPMVLPPEKRKVCAGWQAEVRKRKAKGFFLVDGYRTIRKFVAARATRMLDRSIATNVGPDEKKAARKELEKCSEFLIKKDIGDLEIPF